VGWSGYRDGSPTSWGAELSQHLTRATERGEGFSQRSMLSTVPIRNVVLTALIRADAQRIFNALTFPEYLEMWMSMPDHMDVCRFRATRSAEGFHLQHRDCPGGCPFHVSGFYQACRRRKLIFKWQFSQGEELHTSLVCIRLKGQFGETVLELFHGGFSSAQERIWHFHFW
jgi:uncharacterized protein YndB with AHSA1/START domain